MKNLFIKFIKSSRLRWVLILAAVAAFVVWSGYTGFQEHQIYVYTDHLDEAAAWVDGDAITLRDLSYYVLLEECIILRENMIILLIISLLGVLIEPILLNLLL